MLYNKLPQTQQLKTTLIYYLTVSVDWKLQWAWLSLALCLGSHGYSLGVVWVAFLMELSLLSCWLSSGACSQLLEVPAGVGHAVLSHNRSLQNWQETLSLQSAKTESQTLEYNPGNDYTITFAIQCQLLEGVSVPPTLEGRELCRVCIPGTGTLGAILGLCPP